MLKRTNNIIYKYIKPLSHTQIGYQKRLFCSKKTPVNDSFINNYDINQDNNQQPLLFPKEQEEQQKQEQEEEKENKQEEKKNTRAIRLLAKVVFISSFITIFGQSFLFEEKEFQAADYKSYLKKYGIHSLMVRLTDKDIQSFCNKIVYEMKDFESFYIIYNGYYDQLYQIELIKAGIYKYCVEYLLKHVNQQQQQQQSNESILMEESKIIKDIYYGYLYSASSFKKVSKEDPILYNNEVCILYKKFILKTIEYNKKFGLPDIQLPPQLEYLKKPIASGDSSMVSYEQYKEIATKKSIKFLIFSFATTALYMTFRSSKTLFPNFRGNRISSIILSSMTGGLLLFTTTYKNKQLYGNDLKKFQDNYIKPIVPNIIYDKLLRKRDPWLGLLISCLSTCLLQYRLYFIIPTLFNSFCEPMFSYYS